MKAVIFLDFDGVLHDIDAGDIEWGEDSWRVVGKPGCAPLFCHVPILWDLIKDHDIDLVVHSSWRTDHDLDEIRALFPEEMRDRIVDVTDPTLGRFESIEFYIDLQGVDRYLVLDDDPTPFPENWAPLVVCDKVKGISDTKVQERIQAFVQAQYE